MDYSDSNVLGKIIKKINELRLRYYVDGQGVVKTYWQGDWYAYHEVLKYDKKLKIN